jgi:hypothetical protein
MAGQHSAPSRAWPTQAARALETALRGVADRTVRPLTALARGLVFGLVAGVLALVLLVLALVGLVRVLDVYAFPTRVWASYAVVGGIFVLFGSFLWSKRRRPTQP